MSKNKKASRQRMHMLWFYYIIVNRLSLSAIFALTHSNSWGIIKTEFGGNYFVLGQYVCLNFISKYIEDTLYACHYCTTKILITRCMCIKLDSVTLFFHARSKHLRFRNRRKNVNCLPQGHVPSPRERTVLVIVHKRQWAPDYIVKKGGEVARDFNCRGP